MFQVNDRVRVTKPSSTFLGLSGRVTHVDELEDRITFRMDANKSIFSLKSSELFKL